MTSETIDTIEVLNSIAIAESEYKWNIAVPMTLIFGSHRVSIDDCSVCVFREDNIFSFIGFGEIHSDIYPTKGFRFLERLSEAYPFIRKKLAKP